MDTTDNKSYAEAVAELENILRAIQSDKCDIDQLSQLTRRATVLLKQCRDKLVATEDELKEILPQLQEQ